MRSVAKKPILVTFAAFLALSAGSACANDETIRASCAKDLKMNEFECECIVARVNSELNDKQMMFFMAAIQNDSAGMAVAQGAIGGDEMLELTEFMTTAPASCKGQ
jgi:hypothetical protein